MKITVSFPTSAKNYEIVFLETFADLQAELEKTINSRNYLKISNETIFEKILKPQNLKTDLVLPDGEKYKNWESVEKILNSAFAKNLDRSSIFVAMGGGVVNDMTGLAASVFMRGTNIIQVPTSLLAMVDASIGGKTGIDNKFGKNLIGTFHQPEKVIICYEFLKSLPAKIFAHGVSEMIKHGIIFSRKHFDDLKKFKLKNKTYDNFSPLIIDSVNIKKEIVESDELENGNRMKLNLGHTFGHAVEFLSNFQIAHGEAVAIGTVLATEFAVEKGICDKSLLTEIRESFEIWGLPTKTNFSRTEIWKAFSHDKKKRGQKINLVLPKDIGEVIVLENNL